MPNTQRLEHAIQYGLLILLALMPFHAFLSVWLGSLTGHEAIIQAWKEVLLILLAATATVLVWREPTRLRRFRQPWIILAATFGLVAVAVTLGTHPPLTTIAFGLKTDFEFLVAGAIAALVASDRFMRRAGTVILAGACLVIGFGSLQMFALPPDFLTHFGYGPNTILAYQHITEGAKSLRFPSTLGGPNQLGTYLILPICAALYLAIAKRKWPLLALTTAGIIVLIGTYSRSAWLGALVAAAITLLAALQAKPRRLAIWILIGASVLTLLALPALLKPGGQLQYYLLHSSLAGHDQQKTSDAEHRLSLINGSHSVLAAPLGHGLGTAGPATFHAGTTNIIENYYLQLGYETGLLGMLLFLALIGALLYSLWRHAPTPALVVPVLATIIGISLVALVLPAWTDSSTSLIVWITAGAITGLQRKASRV